MMWIWIMKDYLNGYNQLKIILIFQNKFCLKLLDNSKRKLKKKKERKLKEEEDLKNGIKNNNN